MAKDMPLAWTDYPWQCFVMFGPYGKKYPEFCFPADNEDGSPTSRAAAKASEAANKKRAVSENLGAKQLAIANHNKMLGAKMLLKYGAPEDKERALKIIREIMNEDEVTLAPSLVAVPMAPRHRQASHASPASARAPRAPAPTSTNQIGDDGLTHNQRVCLEVFCDDECMDSPAGFTADDVVNFLTWRDGPTLTRDQVVEAMEFLSSEARIGLTQNPEHYIAA